MIITQPVGDFISKITLPDFSSDTYLNGDTKTYDIKVDNESISTFREPAKLLCSFFVHASNSFIKSI